MWTLNIVNSNVLFSLWWCVEEFEWWWWWCDEWTDCCCGVGCCCCCCFWSCCWTINTFCRICSCWIAVKTQYGCEVEFFKTNYIMPILPHINSKNLIELLSYFFFVLTKHLGFCTYFEYGFLLDLVLLWVRFYLGCYTLTGFAFGSYFGFCTNLECGFDLGFCTYFEVFTLFCTEWGFALFCTYFEWGSAMGFCTYFEWGFYIMFCTYCERGFAQEFCTYFEWGSARPASRLDSFLLILRLSHLRRLPTTQPTNVKWGRLQIHLILTTLCASRITVPWVSVGTAAFIRFLLRLWSCPK